MLKTFHSAFFYLITLFSFSQQWTNLGPFNRINNNGSNGQGPGRIKSLGFHPSYGKLNSGDGNIHTVFGSSIYGGLWVTTDRGKNWSNNNPSFPDLSTDALPGIGVRDFIIQKKGTFTVIYALLLHGNGSSLGVWKYHTSTGWKPTGMQFSPMEGRQLYTITFARGYTGNISVCADDGVYQSYDEGQTWDKVLGSGHKSWVRCMSFSHEVMGTVYAFGKKIWRSGNNGSSWKEVEGLTESLKNKDARIIQTMGVIADSGIVYVTVVYAIKKNKLDEKHFEFLELRDGKWTQLPMFGKNIEWNEDRQTMELSPDGKFLFAGQELLFRYDITAKKWIAVTDYGGNMHPDMHDLEFAPDGSLWVAQDGGVAYCDEDISAGKMKWTHVNNGLSIAQLWDFSVSQRDPNIIFTGETDNGNTFSVNANEPDKNKIKWLGYALADGGEKLVDGSDSGFIYDRHMMYPNSAITKSRLKNGKLTHLADVMRQITPQGHFYEDWATPKPLVQDPKRPDVIYRGLNGLIRTTDGGKTSEMIFRSSVCYNDRTHWGSMITSIVLFPKNTNILFINTYNPYDSTITDGIFKTKTASTCPYITKQGCSDVDAVGCECGCWTDISPNIPGNLTIAQKHLSHITSMAVNDRNHNILYAGFTYNPHAKTIKVMKYQNAVWTNYSEGLPEWTSVRSMVYQPGSEGTVFAGTEDGLWYRNSTMTQWARYGTGMPNVKVIKLEIVKKDNTLYAGTLGRGIWKVEMPVIVVPQKKEKKKALKKN